MASLDWNGKRLAAKAAQASKLAVDRTMADCVADAAANHPGFPPASAPDERYANRTGFQTATIRILDNADGIPGAILDGDTVRGSWGALGNYSLFLEIGTSREGPTATDRELAAAGNMDAVPPPVGPLMAPRPFLRPAADRNYRMLRARIIAAFRGAQMP